MHDQREPSAAELAAIEIEWPLIAAELDLLDAEISLLYADDHGGPAPMDWQRLRRAQRQVLRETAAQLAAVHAVQQPERWAA